MVDRRRGRCYRARHVVADVRPSPLADLERRILAHYADGWTRARIAREESMSVRMVAYVFKRVRWRIGATNTTHAVAIAIRAGWI